MVSFEEGYVAYTPKEGVWEFTFSPTASQAIAKLSTALISRRALKHPIDNPISAQKFRRALAQGGGHE